MTEDKVVVVGVDGSEQSEHALRWAVGAAGARGATVRAVLVWSLLDQHREAGVPFDPDYGEREALEYLHRFVADALGDGANAVEHEVVCDLPVEGLLGAAAGSELLVVGARGLGGFRDLLLGSVSRRVLEGSDVPVAVIRGPAPASGSVVVGADGSAESMGAVRWAADEAVRRGQELVVVHAWTVPWPIDAAGHAAVVGICESQAERVLTEAVSVARREGLHVRPVLVQGGASAALLEAAGRDAELLVVSSRGRSGPLARLLGSVSHQLAHHAPVPLVVVPAT